MAVKPLTIVFFALLVIGSLLIVSGLISSQSEKSKPVSSCQADIDLPPTSAAPNDQSPKASGSLPPANTNSTSQNAPVAGNDDSTANSRNGNEAPPPIAPPTSSSSGRLSQVDQIALGNAVARKEHLDDGAYIDSQIDQIAKRLIRNLPPRYHGPGKDGWPWRIRCKRSPTHEVNAFALPGGRIYIYDGILQLTRRDDGELAEVLGHEMTHVAEEHIAKQLAQSGDVQRVTAKIVNAVSGGDEQSKTGKLAAIAGEIGDMLIHLHLSREDEFQADERGCQMMMKAGYNSNQAIVLLESLQQMENGSGGEKGSLAQCFHDHPLTADRIANLRAKIPTYTKSSIDSK